MVSKKAIAGRKNEIKQLVSIGNLDEAIKLFLDFTVDFCSDFENAAILISSRNSELRSNKRPTSADQYDTSKRAIATDLLNTLDEATKDLDLDPPSASPQALVGDQEALIKLAEEIRQAKIPATPDKLLVQASNIEKTYPRTSFRLQLDKLALHLGQITGLVGENATGKTTLLRIIAGDLKHDLGELSFPCLEKNKKHDWLAIKKQIAYVPQEIPHWHHTLKDTIQYEAAIHGIKGTENRKAVDFIIQRLELAGHIDKSWAQLSGGYKLRFTLAKALVWKPRLLILDEPLANLDIRTQIIVLNDLRNLVKSPRHPLAVLLSSQHLHEVEAVADQMLFMREGQLEHLGSTSTYRSDRLYNCFELGCTLLYSDFEKCMVGFSYQKFWHNGMNYFVLTAPDISGFTLLQHLASKQVEVAYYRDISKSVKTKFYEAYF